MILSLRAILRSNLNLYLGERLLRREKRAPRTDDSKKIAAQSLTAPLLIHGDADSGVQLIPSVKRTLALSRRAHFKVVKLYHNLVGRTTHSGYQPHGAFTQTCIAHVVHKLVVDIQREEGSLRHHR